jgi:uncharacterized protein
VIDRKQYLAEILEVLDSNPVAALLGPRQSGKTTLARLVTGQRHGDFFDLEDPVDRSRLSAPMLTLQNATGLTVIDEIQRIPELFEILRVLADRTNSTSRFLVLGSASPHLVKGASESLAGRIGFVDLLGFNLGEVGTNNRDILWNRGGFPRSYLAENDVASFRWRGDFIRTFLERDIPQLGISIPAETLRRFWTMLAHYHGQVWNAAEISRSLGASESTVRRYLDILSGTYLVRQLQPWHTNIKKRQVKSPKVFIRDSGLLHALLSVEAFSQLLSHPKLGASWEGWMIEEIITAAKTRDVYFWATHSGAELDLLLFKEGKPIGFEIKYTDAPKTSKSMRSALNDLQLDQLFIVYPGTQSYPIDDRISALAANDVALLFK